MTLCPHAHHFVYSLLREGAQAFLGAALREPKNHG